MVKDLLSIDEAAGFLSINREVLRRKLREGLIPGAKFGREWRISRADLSQYYQKNGGGELYMDSGITYFVYKIIGKKHRLALLKKDNLSVLPDNANLTLDKLQYLGQQQWDPVRGKEDEMIIALKEKGWYLYKIEFIFDERALGGGIVKL